MASSPDSGIPRSTEPLALQQFCLDLQTRRNRYHDRFNDFLRRHREVLELEEGPDLVTPYLERVWPNNLPGTLIIANISFDAYGRWLLRPTVEGPQAHRYAAGRYAPALRAYRRQGTLVIDGFEFVPHVPPRPFERVVVAPIRWDPTDVFMTAEDLAIIENLPRQRFITQQRLTEWREYLDWRERLIGINRVELAYEEVQEAEIGIVRFQIKGQHDLDRMVRRLAGAQVEVAASSILHPTEQQPARKKRRTAAIASGRVVAISPKQVREGRSGRKQDDDERLPLVVTVAFERNDREGLLDILPDGGFLATAVGGDLKPLFAERRAVERLCNGHGFNPTLADWMFDIRNAAPPHRAAVVQAAALIDGLDPDQLAALMKAIASDDVMLVLGPPGTGKTTLIAAIAAYFAGSGQRVLIASQTNLAVDNAQSRLTSRPGIRPLRIARADRVEDGFEGWLERNAVGTWFQSIRQACGERVSEWDHKNERLNRAEEAMPSMRRILEDTQDCRQQIAQLNGKSDTLGMRREGLIREVRESQETIANLSRQDQAIRDFAAWLEDPKRDLSAVELPEALSALCIQIITELRDHMVTDHWPLPWLESPATAMGAIASIRSAHIAAEASRSLAHQARQAVELCAGAADPLDEVGAARLRELFDQRGHLLESEREEDLIRVAAINREINQFREDRWAGLSRLIRQDLGQIFNQRIPHDLDDVTTTLAPERRHVDVFQRLLDLSVRVANATESVLGTARAPLTDMTIAHTTQSTARLREKRDVADAANHTIDEIDSQLGTLHDRLAECQARFQDCEQRWMNRWRDVCPDLGAETPAAPMTDEALQERTAALAEWWNGQSTEHQRRGRWMPLLRTWLDRLADPASADRSGLRSLYRRHANVHGMTCLEAGDRDFYERPDFDPFDVVIIDEVSKATPTELLMPMLLGRKVILVGDYRQLKPMFREDERSFEEAVEDGQIDPADFQRFRRFVGSSFFQELYEAAPEPLRHFICTNYRMHPQIMAVTNLFYDGSLVAGFGEEALALRRQHHLRIPDGRGGLLLEPHQSILWVDSSQDAAGREAFEKQQGSSKDNPLEVELIIRSLTRLNEAVRARGYGPEQEITIRGSECTVRQWLERTLQLPPETVDDLFAQTRVHRHGRRMKPSDIVHPGDVVRIDARKRLGVITFYGAQLAAIRRRIGEIAGRNPATFEALDIRCNTVDRFQGMERSIVLVSLVRSVRFLRGGDYVRQYQRINVAFSRAQELLVIFGAYRTFDQAVIDLPPIAGGLDRQVPVYRSIMGHVQQFGGRRYASQLIH